jgi:drug/metabolite transporter (DMT)-like permease
VHTKVAEGNSVSLYQNKNNDNKFTSGSGSKPAMPPINHAGRPSPLGLILLAITSVGWGLNFPIMKLLLTEWPPLSSRGLSGVAGATALALVALARRQKLSVPRQMWSRLLLVSTLAISGWVAFMGLALLWLSASEAAVLGISIPVWVAFLAWPILGERLSPLRAIALITALAGIVVLIGGNGFEASIEKLPGVALALAGAIGVGLGTVLTKHFPLKMPPLALAAWQVGLGCLPVAVVGLVVEQPQLAALSWVGWAALLNMTLIQFCLCYVCWFAALERLPAATASIGTLLVPVVGVLAAAAMLREPLGLREIAALAITLGGVAVALRS